MSGTGVSNPKYLSQFSNHPIYMFSLIMNALLYLLREECSKLSMLKKLSKHQSKFKSVFLQTLMETLFSEAVRRMVGAFEKRANELFK